MAANPVPQQYRDDIGELIAHKKVPLDVVLSGSLKEELLSEAKSGVDKLSLIHI